MLRHLPILAALALCCAGCSSEPYQTAPISGLVTLDGKPVAKAAVMFQPVAVKGNDNPGPGSYGITDAEGRYSLKLIGKETAGAVIGKHRVRIENYTEPGDSSDDTPRRPAKPEMPIPRKYNAVDPKLEFEVLPGGTKAADFPLTSK